MFLLLMLSAGLLYPQSPAKIPAAPAPASLTLEAQFLEVDKSEIRQLGLLLPQGTILTFETLQPPGPAAQKVAEKTIASPLAVSVPLVLSNFLANSRKSKRLSSRSLAFSKTEDRVQLR